jgi:hypothetical protein
MDFKHGLFRLDGSEVWTLPNSGVGSFPWSFLWRGQVISHTGNLVARECNFMQDGSPPVDCFAAKGLDGFVAFRGDNGSTLFKKQCRRFSTLSVSDAGNFVPSDDAQDR